MILVMLDQYTGFFFKDTICSLMIGIIFLDVALV